MEKAFKILKLLPKAASSAVTFKSPPISPVGKPYPGGSIIPRDARRRFKNGSFDAREPASPIVSCVGRVKGRSKKKPAGRKLPRQKPKLAPVKEPVLPGRVKKGGRSNMIMKLVSKKWGGGKSDEEEDIDGAKPPSLGHLKQFSSGRGILANFDWRVHGGHGAAAVVPDGGPEEIVLKPKNEINLWKRRTMVPPPPLIISV